MIGESMDDLLFFVGAFLFGGSLGGLFCYWYTK
jgi:hypothetical protein